MQERTYTLRIRSRRSSASRVRRSSCFSLGLDGATLFSASPKPVEAGFLDNMEKESAVPQEKERDSSEKHQVRSVRSLVVGFTAFLFILLQSACTAFMAISGLRLLIGIGSFAAAAAGQRFLDSIHGAAIRIPMEALAITGSVINLMAVRRVRQLRARPASQWRMKPVSAEKLRSESWQVLLALVTLLLVGVEWGVHIYLYGTI